MKLIMNPLLPCGLLLVLSHAVAAVKAPTAQVVEPAHLSLRQQKGKQPSGVLDGMLDDPVDIPKPTLPPIEIPGQPKRKARVMDMINKFRAEICFKMKDEHGKKFDTFKECEDFMEEACEPGKDKTMDGDRKEVTSGEGYCKEYFPAAKKKAEEEVDKEDKEKAAAAPAGLSGAPGPAPAPAPAPESAAPAPAPAKAEEAPAPAPKAKGDSPAPAPGPGSSPSGAPGPSPVASGDFTPGKSKGQPAGVKDDEKYYYAKGGKDMDRMHMDENMKLPTQGYWGKLVEHEDMETATADWGKEFGPGSGHASYAAICKDHPENPWCQDQGFNRRCYGGLKLPNGDCLHKSSSPTMATSLLPMVFALAAFVTI